MRVDLCLKLASALFFAALVCGPAAGAAHAQGPPQEVSYFNVYAAGEACAFPVSVEVSGREKVIFLPGDRVAVASPGLRVTFTNLDDPSKRSTQVITGAVHVTFLENGDAEIVFTGRNFLEGFNPELPTLALTIGQLSIALDPVGNFVRPPQGSARVINVCSLIE